MRKITIQICLLALFALPCAGQHFVYHSISPFGIETNKPDSTRTAQTIFFNDYDHDGDFDLFLTGLDYLDDVPDIKWVNIHFFIEVQENIGNRNLAQFGPRREIFEDFPFATGYFFPTPGDLNGDNKTDFITSADIDWIGNEKVWMLMNTGLSGPGSNVFDVTSLDAMGIPDFVPESLFAPHLTDLDGDGDLDLLATGVNSAFAEEDGPNVPVIYYARNVGDVINPDFHGWYDGPYGLVPAPEGEILTSGDIDNDGDMDLIGFLLDIPSDSVNYISVHVNTPGANGKPSFGTVLKSPFGMPLNTGENQPGFPNLVDIDADGDLDLFVFHSDFDSRELEYYENTMCETVDPSVFIDDHTLTAAMAGATYQWFDCDSGENIPGATNQTYEVTTTGNYAVYVTSNGCKVQSMCLNIIISRIQDVLADGLTFFPNPTTGIVHVKNDSSYPVNDVTITSISGQVIGHYSLDGKNTVDLSSLDPGVYLVSTKINGYDIMKKLVVF
ncbi:MAG TPA: T9SS type A sorting domain-containing protein [Saprospiraceae bacterium]|nr:T9SS type A sorting domain-containing protein [Saprospiraceae bacterium]